MTQEISLPRRGTNRVDSFGRILATDDAAARVCASSSLRVGFAGSCGRVLAFPQAGEQHYFAVRKFERIAVTGTSVLVDLPKPRHLRLDRLAG
jgi:hypothetical protein